MKCFMSYHISADRRPNGRRSYYRGPRRGPRRPRPPPQDSQGEDKTEGTEGELWLIKLM